MNNTFDVRRQMLQVLATTAAAWSAGTGAQPAAAAALHLRIDYQKCAVNPVPVGWPGAPAHGLRWAI